MKQAKEEAQAEIDGYRKQREDQYQKYEKSVSFHLRIECILLKFHCGMKALTKVHFQWSVENVVRSTLSYPQWNFKRMYSILIIIFKSHQNLI